MTRSGIRLFCSFIMDARYISELSRDTTARIRYINFLIRSSTTLTIRRSTTNEEMVTSAHHLKSCRRSIKYLNLKFHRSVYNPLYAEHRLELLRTFGREMEGAVTDIQRLLLTFRSTVPGAEGDEAKKQSNAELAALGPFFRTNSTIESVALNYSHADERGIRAFLRFFISNFKFRVLKSASFSSCPNFGYNAVRVLFEVSREAKHQWDHIQLHEVPIGNAEMGLLLNRMNIKSLYLANIPLDDVGATTIASAILSKLGLETLGLLHCVTERRAQVIRNSVYDQTSLKDVMQSNHTLRSLEIRGEFLNRFIAFDEFYNRLDPNGERPALKDESFKMLKVVTYLRQNFKPGDEQTIPQQHLPKWLEAFGRHGEVNPIFNLVRNMDPAQFISD